MDTGIWSHLLVEARFDDHHCRWTMASCCGYLGERGRRNRRSAPKYCRGRDTEWRHEGFIHARWRTVQENAEAGSDRLTLVNMFIPSMIELFIPTFNPKSSPLTRQYCSAMHGNSSWTSLKLLICIKNMRKGWFFFVCVFFGSSCQKRVSAFLICINAHQ